MLMPLTLRWRSPVLLRCRNAAAGCLQMREARVRRSVRAGEDLGAKARAGVLAQSEERVRRCELRKGG